jgi:hypothetical protein
MRKILAAMLILYASTACAATSPCDGVDGGLSDESKAKLAPVIAKQLHVSSVDVLQSFRLNGWNIVYVDSHQADQAFLFYSRDPLTSPYVTLWSGAATTDEEQQIKEWTLKSAPGIPDELASCFAWHVTNGDM